MEGGMRERSGRDYENLSSLKTLVFMRVSSDLLRDGGIFNKIDIETPAKAAALAIKKRDFFPTWECLVPS